MKYADTPRILREFLTYIDTIKGRSKNTAYAYYADLRTYFRFLKVYRGIVPEPKNFYSSNYNKALQAISDIPINDVSIELIADVTLEDLYEYMAYLNRARNNHARSRARKVSSLRAFYGYLYNKAKVIDHNPAAELETPKIGKTLPKYLDIDDSMALLNAVEGKNAQRDYLILTLFLNCGLRLSELVGINLSDIRGNTLTVVGKGNKQRTIYLNDACKKALDAYLAVRPRDKVKDRNALFLSRNKERLGQRSVQNIVKKYLKLAGLDAKKYSPHKLRHTAATLMYKHGNVDIRILQEILGHSNLSTTEIYTHLDDDTLRDAIEKPACRYETKLE